MLSGSRKITIEHWPFMVDGVHLVTAEPVEISYIVVTGEGGDLGSYLYQAEAYDCIGFGATLQEAIYSLLTDMYHAGYSVIRNANDYYEEQRRTSGSVLEYQRG